MQKHVTVGMLLGIVLTACAIAGDAPQKAADAIQKCKCGDAKCADAKCADAKCADAKCATAELAQTVVAAKLVDTKAVCANPSKCSKTNTVAVSADTVCHAAECATAECSKANCANAQCAKTGCKTQACEDTVALKKGVKCVVKAMIQGEYQGSTDKNVQLVVTVPGGETGLPFLSNIPYCNRVFKNTGSSSKVVVLDIPRKHVEFIAPRTANVTLEKLAPVVTKTCSSKECTAATSACKSDTVAKDGAVYTFTFQGHEDGTCKTQQVPTAVVSHPKRPHPVLPRPAYVPVPPPTAYSPYYAPCTPVVASCKCGANCGCKGTDKLADSNVLERLAAITAENARLKGHLEARNEAAAEKEALREQLFEVRLEHAKLEASFGQREELMEMIVEATVEKAEMEAHMAIMEERMQLQEEIAELRQAKRNSNTDERVESIAVELKRSRSQNAELKAIIAELEAKIKAISERVASQRPPQVR